MSTLDCRLSTLDESPQIAAENSPPAVIAALAARESQGLSSGLGWLRVLGLVFALT